MQVNINEGINNQNFGKFVKIAGKKDQLKQFRNQMRADDSSDFCSFIRNKTEKQADMYVFSGVDYDRILDLMGKVQFFFEVRMNPEKFFKNKPKEYNLKEAKQRFSNKELL